MLVGELQDERAGEAFERLVNEHRIDGLIVATARASPDPIERLSADTRPFLFVNRRVPGASRSVTADDEAGGVLAARALIEAGHKELGIVAGPDNVDTAKRRRVGFELGCRELGVSRPRIAETPYTAEGGYHALKQLLAFEPRPTGVFASNLLVSIGALHAIHESGLAIPADISLVGFDDNGIASHTWPPLTSIRMPFEEMGETAVDELRRIISGDAPRDIVVPTPPHLVNRATLGPAPWRGHSTPSV
jgi:DNA-binding LacI/PurR family transcriptional regulator